MAKNIQYYMDAAGKTRTDICRDLGIKYTTFTDWIKGNTYPRIDKIEIMANYFGISKADLVEDHMADIQNDAKTSALALSEDAQELCGLIPQLDPEQQALLLAIAKNFLQGSANK